MRDENVGYRAAIDELEEILDSIESTDVDVDELSQKVRRAQQLIELCTERIRTAQENVEQVIETLDDGDV